MEKGCSGFGRWWQRVGASLVVRAVVVRGEIPNYCLFVINPTHAFT